MFRTVQRNNDSSDGRSGTSYSPTKRRHWQWPASIRYASSSGMSRRDAGEVDGVGPPTSPSPLILGANRFRNGDCGLRKRPGGSSPPTAPPHTHWLGPNTTQCSTPGRPQLDPRLTPKNTSRIRPELNNTNPIPTGIGTPNRRGLAPRRPKLNPRRPQSVLAVVFSARSTRSSCLQLLWQSSQGRCSCVCV